MKKTILVTGDPICDHNYYKGQRQTADSDEKRGFRFYCTGGGALLLKDLIDRMMKGEKQGDQEWGTEFGLNPEFEQLPWKYHSYCIWEPQAGGGDEAKTKYWRAMEPPLGYGHEVPFEFSLAEFNGELTVKGLILAIKNAGLEVPTAPSEIDSLNQLLGGPCLCSKFPGLDLSEQIKDLIKCESTLNSKERIELNRLIIEALCPQACPKTSADDQSNTCCPKTRYSAYSPRSTPGDKTPAIVVIDDAGIGFREKSRQALWPSVKARNDGGCPDWIVLKMTGPIGGSPLLSELAESCRKNLVVIVPARELRRREVRLSRGLSWEATAEDLVFELYRNPQLNPLLKARHLIVTFQSDGAFWLDNDPGGAKSLLVFDALRAEGEWTESQGEGGAFGYLSCFTAAIVRELCLPSKEIKVKKTKANPDGQTQRVPDFEVALGVGLGASRELRKIGHGEVGREDKNNKPGFPFDQIIATIRKPQAKFVSAVIPPPPEERGNWMMLDEWQVNARNMNKSRPHYEAALAVAVLGPEALERFPVAQFGKYKTVDRKEIESLRTIRQLIVTYVKDKKPKSPLNLGIFGPPGSGKSYIVGQIAKAANISKDDVLLFNLSQFKDSSEICGALHRVRDKVLKGVTPLVFWDEFDSGGYKWLQFLLAPMEDGEFQDGQITHPLGNCIFAFAGATASTFAEFGPINPNKLAIDVQDKLEREKKLAALQEAWKAFVLAKGPDFKSRVVAYLNLLGMNRRQVCDEKDGRRKWSEDLTDLCFPIRRALFMRTLFDLNTGDTLKLDLNMVRALIEIPEYLGAGRSLQFLCTQLKGAVGQSSGRSSMPSPELLSMHVDAKRFWELCEQDADFAPKAKELARLLHRGYCLRTIGNAEKKDAHVDFESLPEDLQKANVAQALRIPVILRLAGMHLEKGAVVPFDKLIKSRRTDEKPLRQHLAEKDRLDVLAEAEHNGWMVERMINGWKFSRKKDKPNKLHDCLIPYSQLTDDTKGYDRLTITGKAAPSGHPEEEQFGYVDIVKIVGLRVVMDK